MPVVAGILCAVVLLGGVAYAARVFRLGLLDAMALSAKLSIPHPRSARDWPEARLTNVIAAPDGGDDVVVVARWPGRPGTTSSVVLLPSGPRDRALRLLSEWCDHDTSLSPMRWGVDGIELRPRGTTERLFARVLAEELTTGIDPRRR